MWGQTQKVVTLFNGAALRLVNVMLSGGGETEFQKECVVNALLMAKLVRPTEGIPPGRQVPCKARATFNDFTASLPHEADVFTRVRMKIHIQEI